MRKIFFWVLASLFLTWIGAQYWPVSVQIRGPTRSEDFSIRMPLKDKKRLEYFFRDVCFLNEWAYTLIGSKPMSIHQYTKPWAAIQYFIYHPELKYIFYGCFCPPNFRKICLYLNPQQLKIKLGWEALNKYLHHFPNSRFILHESEFLNNEIVDIRLIDKKKMLNTVMNHLEDFQTVLQDLDIKPEELLGSEKVHQFLNRIKTNGLFGTILGFGRDNAWLYEKYRELNPEKWPLTSPWVEFEDEHLERLNKKDLSFEPWDLSDLFYPPFACDPNSEETRKLKLTYKEEREEIVKYYEGKDVVEATLSLFNQK